MLETLFGALMAAFFTGLENYVLFFHLSGGGSRADESAVYVISPGFDGANVVACSSPAGMRVVRLVDINITKRRGGMER